ncbi:glycosyltransferase family 2 protein [Streptomyces sp. H10-C2]|uniref:glycosyltransferase family 2 protein n=1 Tax=unclassified Streptomyces TaxID=2593676 RepID=UPI0024BB7475|nr:MULTISPECIES: glycosyltransferase family 2 protein [unclassified Streptomyces]MDJ0342461.1 glycosyltransferase family 2 protein [Streptomyces sp. PH10-H1]MDJ0372316.1 glycosyltransferase family 2 protein [Streptomyces sp. H10-C2]
MPQDYRDAWVVIPVFNEAQVIAGVVNGVRETFPNVVCVDDGSSDASSREILSTGAHLVRHPVNLGQGAALQTGVTYALAQPGAKWFVTFDADGQHQVKDACSLVDAVIAGETDVVLGSRFLEDHEQVPLLKRIVLRTTAAISPTARKLRLTDAHNGLRAFNRTAASQLRITMNGMAHASEMMGILARSGLRVQELPVTVLYTDYSRAKGQSLINGVNILTDLAIRAKR